MNIKKIFKTESFFIIGIGGSGMSSIAKYLREAGAIVQGYDQRTSQITNQLLKLGVVVTTDININIPSENVVLTSSAINSDNELLKKSLSNKLRVINRPDFLAELTKHYKTIGISGTHGKTTTSSLLSHIYQYNNVDHSYIYGGITSYSGIGGHFGNSKSLVLEADEAFKTFVNFKLDNLILTNIDDDHIDHYGTFESLVNAFEEVANNTVITPILNIDNPYIKKISKNLNSITYGEAEEADYRYIDENTVICDKKELRIEPNIPGKYFMLNAIAALANADLNGLEIDKVLEAIDNFPGVKRRLELVGISRNISVYDDYGHHPTEMSATISSLKNITIGKLYVIFQPHRYTRTQMLFDRFIPSLAEADESYILDIYSAGEMPIPGISTKILLEQHHVKNIKYISSLNYVLDNLTSKLSSGDTVLTLGAGDITLLSSKILEMIND